MTWLLGTLAELAAARQPRIFPPTSTGAPEPQEYIDARMEARTFCRNLGLDVDNQHWDNASVADFIRLAYAQGWKACESRLTSPDVADAIAVALKKPTAILGDDTHLAMPTLVIQAMQRAAVYGVPK